MSGENKVRPLPTLILEVSRRRSLTRSLSATTNVNDDVYSPPADSVVNTASNNDKYSIVNARGLNYRIIRLAVLFIEKICATIMAAGARPGLLRF